MTQAKISDSEMYVMNYLWTQSAGAKIGDICRAVEIASGKIHKQQAVRVFLKRLESKGFVKVYTEKVTKQNVYIAAETKEAFLQKESERVVNGLFNGSVFDFLVSFSGGTKISREDAEKIRMFLKK